MSIFAATSINISRTALQVQCKSRILWGSCQSPSDRRPAHLYCSPGWLIGVNDKRTAAWLSPQIVWKPPRQLLRIVFWSGIRLNGPKMPIFAKFGRFWAKNPIFGGQGVKILVPSYRDSNETPFSCWKHWSVRLQLAARGENVLFWPQNLDIWGQKSIFVLE